MKGLLATLMFAATIGSAQDAGMEGYLCNRPTPGNPLLQLAAKRMEKDEASAPPAFRATDEERGCSGDGDCVLVAGVCNRCWLTVNTPRRASFVHEIQRRESKESCLRPNLGPAAAYCKEGLCRLKASP